MTTYTVTVDREACDGVFACLVRDDRFREDGDGLATLDADDAVTLERSADRIVARFDDDARDAAEGAAAACPLDAIAVGDAETGADPDARGTETDAERRAADHATEGSP